ncbi:tyrosine 3-monooxygenase-like isoform X2 [Hyperolius riggenbachi]|uniref:tyrosine 3-monooxygenase-like isoform X2 n=1 Tax=Hyperolius riggenbachi TaxID=752182 RepID=UPI0035A31D05
MKAEVGGCQCRKQSLIEDARKEKDASALTTGEPSEVHGGGLGEGCGTTLNIIFTARSPSVSSLNAILKILEKYEAHVHHMETRAAIRFKKKDDLECFVKCFIHSSSINICIYSLEKVAGDVKIVRDEALPTFPKKVKDLDMCQHAVVKFEPHFDRDHPGYGDQEYKKRRAYFAELAYRYRDGDSLPRIEYTAEETATWKQVYKSLSTLYPNYACKQYLDGFHQLEKYCGFSETSIPQLQDVSNFLKEKTGFKLRPAAGLLSARDFLACLSFRVFPSTQYLRHSSAFMHSPEPDCCHELLGHIPMLADREFAQFSQDIGLASLGVSDEEIEKLATYALSNKPELQTFDAEVAAVQPYEDNCFQPVYFVSESFEDSKAKLRQYALKIKKSFSLRYDPLTCSVEVLDSLQKVQSTLHQIKDDLHSLCSALDKLG